MVQSFNTAFPTVNMASTTLKKVYVFKNTCAK